MDMEIRLFLLWHAKFSRRDQSLITGGGGATKWEGSGHVQFYPNEKGAGTSFSRADRGYEKSFHSLRGAAKNCRPPPPPCN